MKWVQLNGVFVNIANATSIKIDDSGMRITWIDSIEDYEFYPRKGPDENMIMKIEEWLKSQVYEFRSRSY